MKLKIFGETKHQFNTALEDILNVATLICLRGSIPHKHEMENPLMSGRWWHYEETGGNKRYQLVSGQNDNWCNIYETGENYIIVKFNFRYQQKLEKTESMYSIIKAFFSHNVELIGE
jgi:hypothetical protein